MGCGKSKEARAVAPLPARQSVERFAQLIPADPAPVTATLGGGHAGAESSRDQPALSTTGGSGAASPPGKHAPGSGHPPPHRPTLPPLVEAHGGEVGALASMVRTIPLVMETQLERSL